MSRTTYIGDSLGVGTSQYLHARENTKVGRTSREAVDILERRPGKGKVVLDVGSNDGSAAELRASLKRARRAIGDRKLVLGLVGPGVTDAAAKNKVIREFADETVRTGKTSDGVHPADYRKRASRIKRKLRGPGATKVKPRASAEPAATAGNVYERLNRIRGMFT